MEENITLVFHGFLNLNMKEKLRLVEEMNRYFDAIRREPIREENEQKFSQLDLTKIICKCCGK